ncbi:Ada metal-binding domain-containing protein [Nonomuraea rhizosphaerae]|uniref:Ada metal-binding domain-containing protein n=1 Tax=Nonomuraea rhizosphaerae TaxID=2665663 RepID=UPI001FE5890B|nr:Ada metal-binding domain-containing protein [Nonomuraea rhizosphaerae]
MHTLIGADGWPYRSAVPGTLGGHRRARLYGRLDCPSALRAITRGGYVGERVFFADEATAIAAGYRPCSVCLPATYRSWKEGRHTTAELAGVIELLDAARPRAGTVVVGHGRDAAPTARAFAEAWEGDGRTVLAMVDWPEEAASWLRQARRFAAGDPDAWVVAGAPAGWARMGERLRLSTGWDPGRTYGFAATAQAVALAAPGTLEGMRGVDADGTTWRLGRNLIHREAT